MGENVNSLTRLSESLLYQTETEPGMICWIMGK